jgi:hypothetical protein
VDLSITILIGVLAAVTLAGLGVRRRLRLSWSLGLYLLSIAIINALLALWPGRFLTWPYYVAIEITHASLKVAMAIELSRLVFRAFPTAGRFARFGLFVILVIATTWVASSSPSTMDQWVRVALPRLKCGEALMLTWLLMVVLWYRIPLHFLHKAILMALAPYLLIFAVGLQALHTFRWAGFSQWRYLNLIAFIGVLGSLLYCAWRPEDQEDVHASVAKTVQPWA